MSRPNFEDNIKYYTTPEPGNVWHEMMCVYHIVLAATGEDRLVIAERDFTFKEGQTFDLAKAKEITKEEHLKIVTYSGNVNPKKGPTFVADVWVKPQGIEKVIEEWKNDHGGKYISIEDRDKDPISKTEELLKGGVPKGTIATLTASGKTTHSQFLYKHHGFRVVRSMRDVETEQGVEALVQFKYKGHQVTINTVKLSDEDKHFRVTVRKGENGDLYLTAVNTVEEAIAYIDKNPV